jgi:VCBS repeat-containing protein
VFLTTGGTVDATYVAGSGTDTLTFQYTVAPGNQALTGITTASAIDLNGGAIKDAAGNAANGAGLNLTGEPSLAGVDINAIVPAVASVIVPLNGTYVAAQDLDFTVNFTEVVTVNTGRGTPYLQLTLDTGGTVDATYLSGSGGTALVFRYAVTSGKLDTDGITVGPDLVLNSGTIQDAFGNNAATALNNVGSTTGVLVDSIPPTVTSINTADNVTNNLHTEHFTVTFSTDVSLNPPDTTDFSLHATGTVSGTVASVAAVSGSVYTVTVTGVTGDGTLRLDLNTSGSTITDQFGNVLTAAHTGDQSYTIDHIAPGAPTVVLAHDTGTSNTDGITSNPAITVTPAESGGTLLYKIDGATSFSTTAPNFATNGSADGPHTVTVEQQDAAGNIGPSTTLSFTLDTIAPAAPVNALSLVHDTGISGTDHLTNDPMMIYVAPASGDYCLFKVDNGSFSAAVPAFATDHSADGLHTISVEEVDTAGNISAPEILTFKLDTIAPEITAVTALPSNGVEGVGETVAIKVAFGEAVAVTGGTPTLSLNDHGTATYDAAATAALHDASKLVFDYTVGVSDTITSPLAVTGINLHGAAIGDLAGNAANLSNVATTFTGLGIDSSLIAANPDSNHVVAGQTVSADAAHGVLANDTDSNPSDHVVVGAVDGLSADVNQPVAGAYGSLTVHADGSYAYSASGSVAGVAFVTFTYTASNGHSTPSTSTLTVEVVGANQNFVQVPSGGSVTGGYGNTVLDGSAGNVTLTAATTFNAHQILIGGPGDVLNAASFGQDTFVFANNFGHDTINNFHPALDFIQLQQSQFGSLAAVMADIQQVGADSVLTLDANHVITIANTPHASLTAADFHLM